MTTGRFAAVETVLAKVDWLAERGARIMRAAAMVAWAGAIVATFVTLSPLGSVGWLVGAICMLPGWVLWRYGTTLANALDVARIRGQPDEMADQARRRVGDVVAGVKRTRHNPVRGGLSVLKTVRAVRADLSGFGIDVSGIAQLTAPPTVAAAAGSLVGAVALWGVSAIGLLVRIAV